jgi:4-alpha-glucanotransferase
MAGFARRLRRNGERWEARATRLEQGFARYWNAEQHCLYDVLDGPFGADASIRPNQILALSLPDSPLAAAHRRSVLARCAHDLLTSYGLRSLSPEDPRYLGCSADEPALESRAAVLGSAWTWLLPHYALAHHRMGGDRAASLELLEPVESLMRGRGLGLLPERSDGAPPHAARGLEHRAWPVAETLRVYHLLTGVRRDLRRREMTRATEAAGSSRKPVRVGA